MPTKFIQDFCNAHDCTMCLPLFAFEDMKREANNTTIIERRMLYAPWDATSFCVSSNRDIVKHGALSMLRERFSFKILACYSGCDTIPP